MKKILSLVIAAVCLMNISSNGQQYLRMTQYMYNPYFLNPAVAGTLNQVPLFLSYRNQWAGYKGAPTTFMASGHFMGPKNSGFGGIITHDDMGGAITRTGIDATGAYHIDLNNYDAISFGLSLTARQFKFDNSKLVVLQPEDQELNGMQAQNRMLFDANFGFIIYGKNYYAGFSVPQLVQTKIKFPTTQDEFNNKDVRHYQLMGSYRHRINENFDFQPSAFMRFTGMTPVQLDINLKMGFQDMFWGGITYRHKDALALNVSMQKEEFFIGYSFDFVTGPSKTLSPFTHEILVGYIIPGKRGRYQSRGALGPRMLDRGRLMK